MEANFPEAPKSRNNDWKELWRRRKMKTKTKAREKRDIRETGVGKAITKFRKRTSRSS